MTEELVAPLVGVRISFVAALREFHREGRHEDLDPEELARPQRFASYVAHLHAEALPETPRPTGWVAATTLWYLDAGEYLGTLQIRHRLTPTLREVGGHIGYEVRPTARGRGHATRMLALSLPVAKELGISRALVTCDNSNVASRKVIEANAGVADIPIGVKLRYWITTAT